MKYFIASDIHGSYKFCKMMVEKFKESNADKLILLGDILYHGPRNSLPQEYNPKKVIELLNNISEKIICVRGNCDAEVDQMVLDFPIMCENSSILIDNKFFKCYPTCSECLKKEPDEYNNYCVKCINDF